MKWNMTLKKLCEYVIIIWGLLMVIDISQTFFALTVIGNGQYEEMNPLGYPLGAVVAVSIWFFQVLNVEFAPWLMERSDKYRSYVHPYLMIIFCGLLVVAVQSGITVIHNFSVLSQP